MISKLAIFLFLITGSAYTFGILCSYSAFKLQTNQYVSEGNYNHKHFFHPYMQSLTIFIGQLFCLLLFFILKLYKEVEIGKSKAPVLIFAIPALLDGISSSLSHIGLIFIPGSTYVMIRGTEIITTVVLLRIFLKMKIQKKHVLGCIFALIGLVIVGGAEFIHKSASTKDESYVGYIALQVGLVFNGCFYVYEQKLFKKYSIHPLQMAGFEGLFGTMIMGLVVFIFQYVPCSFGKSQCVFNDQNEAFMQIPSVYWRQITASVFLMACVIAGILLSGIKDYFGLCIVKASDALTRNLMNIGKTSIVWAVGIIITLLSTDESFQLQSLDWLVNLVKFVGFVFIIFGNLIYREVIWKAGAKVQKGSLLLDSVDS